MVLCHRIVWSVLFLGVVVSVRGEWKAIRPILRSRRNVLLLSGGSVLIALNWLIFIYAVGSHQVLESSLGYFINPLLSVALGVFFLRERLRAWQWVAVLIAGVAVANLALRGAGFPGSRSPWPAPLVSTAWCARRWTLTRCTACWSRPPCFSLALAVLAFVPARATPGGKLGILSLSGVITAVPLLMFGAALRRLKLSTIGSCNTLGRRAIAGRASRSFTSRWTASSWPVLPCAGWASRSISPTPS